MKKKYAISMDIQEKIGDRVDTFNEKNLSKKNFQYCPYIRGKFIYLWFLFPDQSFKPVCRLSYSENLEDMEFAMYNKYSTKKYNPNKHGFPGEKYVDGTLEGAMKAGLKAYSKNKSVIPKDIQKKIMERVDAFKEKELSKTYAEYRPQIKGKFIYLMRTLPNEAIEDICRLTYSGDLEDMELAVYRYSTEKYHLNEFGFPGEEYVDGTLEGAMKAGLEIYPIYEPPMNETNSIMQKLFNLFR